MFLNTKSDPKSTGLEFEINYESAHTVSAMGWCVCDLLARGIIRVSLLLPHNCSHNDEKNDPGCAFLDGAPCHVMPL